MENISKKVSITMKGYGVRWFNNRVFYAFIFLNILYLMIKILEEGIILVKSKRCYGTVCEAF